MRIHKNGNIINEIHEINRDENNQEISNNNGLFDINLNQNINNTDRMNNNTIRINIMRGTNGNQNEIQDGEYISQDGEDIIET